MLFRYLSATAPQLALSHLVFSSLSSRIPPRPTSADTHPPCQPDPSGTGNPTCETTHTMIHPHTRVGLVNEHIGLGVFATDFIPRGTITFVKDALDLVITPSQYRALPRPLRGQAERFSYIDENGDRILSWDHAKHVNHSCEANTLSTGWGFEIAIRDILPGEELTDDYGLFNLPRPMDIACGCTNCRKRLRKRDFPRLADHWDTLVTGSLPHLYTVPQPLLPLLDRKTLRSLKTYTRTGKHYRSVRHLYHQPIPQQPILSA